MGKHIYHNNNNKEVFKLDLLILVNRTNPLPSDYAPEDLIRPGVIFDTDGDLEKHYLREPAAYALEGLFDHAARNGLYLAAISGYRSYGRQKEIYDNNLKTKGFEHTNMYSAKPGQSEHQTGLAMDISTCLINYDLDEAFADTKEGKWVEKNCHHFGFILRYPKNKTKITGYAYEPWHLRYVGSQAALKMTNMQLTLEEYHAIL